METLDVLVIGAGWSGLAALRTYRQVNPTANVGLLDSASSVGGVWAQHRLWDGLKSNNMRGTYEFSDFPMDDSFGVKPGEHIPGHIVQSYLQRYADHFGLTPAIRLNARVTVIEHRPDDGSWALTYVQGETDSEEGQEKQIIARKLIIATGITSQPYRPAIAGQETFDSALFHSSETPTHHSILRDPSHRVVVLGGTKSAWDAVYTAATAGAQVDWIIRDNGHGPCWMAPPYVTPLHRWLEKLVTTRLLTWFSPCIWSDPTADGGARIRSFLHGTWLGRKITDAFWGIMSNDVISLNRYDSHPETAKLKPWTTAFWVASGLSILNYPTNFFDLVRDGKVRVHIDHIAHLSPRSVHLASQPTTPLTNIDALVLATGWKPTANIEFRPATLARDLGFPTADDSLPPALVSAADAEILRRFPRLITPPPRPNHTTTFSALAPDAQSQASHPYRLSRFIVPPSLAADRSVAFAGVAMTINTPLLAQTQALWIAAFFSGKLTLTPTEHCPPDVRATLADHKLLLASSAASSSSSPSSASPAARVAGITDDSVDIDLLWETALHSQFGVHRYRGGFGKRNPDFVFDAIPYVDTLLRDVGVKTARKKGSKQWFEPHGMEDYVGVVDEWMASQASSV